MRRDDRPRYDERPARSNFTGERQAPPTRKPWAKTPAPAASEKSAPVESKPAAPAPVVAKAPAAEPAAPKSPKVRPSFDVPPKKASRRTPEEQTRLYMNVGSEMGVEAGDVVGAILGETGLPKGTVGVVDVRERHVFVDVAKEHANGIISKLNRAQIKGRKLKVKVA